MEPTITTSPAELQAWLHEHAYFEECYCLSARPSAEDYPPEYAEYLDKPDVVSFELAYQVGGGRLADEIRIMRVFGVTAQNIQQWTPSSTPDPYMDEGVALFEANDALGLDLDRNGRLICGRLVIEQLPDRHLPNEPNPDPSSLVAWVPGNAPPTPSEWIEWFREAGEDVGWRVYGGAEWPADQMPTDKYSAFLQHRHEISTTAGGIFVEVRQQDGLRIVMDSGERWGKPGAQQPGLWIKAQEVLLRFPEVRIRSGNCPFTGSQWRVYVTSGSLPDYRAGTKG